MHVIPAEILNGHNKILIDNITSELIVIENTVDQNDIDDNEEMEDLQESLLNLSVEMIQNLHESPYAKKSTKKSDRYRINKNYIETYLFTEWCVIVVILTPV